MHDFDLIPSLTCLMAWKWSSLENFQMWPLKTVHVAIVQVERSHTNNQLDPLGLQCSISWWVFCLFFFYPYVEKWDSKSFSHYCWIVFFSPPQFYKSLLNVFFKPNFAIIGTYVYCDSSYPHGCDNITKKSLSLTCFVLMSTFSDSSSLIVTNTVISFLSFCFQPTYIFEFKYVSLDSI